MANALPTIPEDKVEFYRRKLWREVSNLFAWENMPKELPLDYLENTLVRKGRVLFFNDSEVYGHMVLEAVARGKNIYGQSTTAECIAPNDQGLETHFKRTIVHKYDDEIDLDNSAVMINNMYDGESLHEIVEHYAKRLTLIQNAFDTNALWQNLPVTWSVSDDKMKTTIEEWFSQIYSGRPMIIVDKALMSDNEVIGNVTEVPFILDKLYDVKNEIYNEFKATIGLNAPGADKKERLVVAEATSNEESKDTCLEIMLGQRKIACEEINKVFGLNVSVKLITDKGDENNGTSEHGIENGDPIPGSETI